MAEVDDVMMRNLRASLGSSPAVTPTTDTSSRRTGSSGVGNGSGDPPMDHCATPGILGTSEGQFGPREVPATIAKQSSGSIVMPPPSFPVDLSTPIRREAELESMNYQVPPATTQRFGAEAIGTSERWQHGLHAGGMMTERPLGVVSGR